MSHDRRPSLEVINTQIQVGFFRFAHCGIGHMAVIVSGEQQGVVGQAAEFAHAVIHVCRIRAGQVDATAAVDKQCVAADERVLNLEALAAWGVPRGVQEFDFDIADTQGVTGFHTGNIRLRTFGDLLDAIGLKVVGVELDRIGL